MLKRRAKLVSRSQTAFFRHHKEKREKAVWPRETRAERTSNWYIVKLNYRLPYDITIRNILPKYDASYDVTQVDINAQVA